MRLRLCVAGAALPYSSCPIMCCRVVVALFVGDSPFLPPFYLTTDIIHPLAPLLPNQLDHPPRPTNDYTRNKRRRGTPSIPPPPRAALLHLPPIRVTVASPPLYRHVLIPFAIYPFSPFDTTKRQYIYIHLFFYFLVSCTHPSPRVYMIQKASRPKYPF